ncbi:hypothetical protein D3C84_1146960 [compost metagenome]
MQVSYFADSLVEFVLFGFKLALQPLLFFLGLLQVLFKLRHFLVKVQVNGFQLLKHLRRQIILVMIKQALQVLQKIGLALFYHLSHRPNSFPRAQGGAVH